MWAWWLMYNVGGLYFDSETGVETILTSIADGRQRSSTQLVSSTLLGSLME